MSMQGGRVSRLTGLLLITGLAFVMSTPLAIAEANDKDRDLIMASMKGDVEKVISLLNAGTDVNGAVGSRRFTPLMMAARRGRLPVVQVLLDKGAVVDARDDEGSTALINAVQNNSADVATVLLDKGADVNVAGKNDWTPLVWGVWMGHLEVVQLLLNRGADVNAGVGRGRTALMEAAAADHQLKAERHQGPWGPVYPSRERDPEIVKLLLQKGADVNARDKDGWTALKRAQKRGSTNIVELLKAHGAKE